MERRAHYLLLGIILVFGLLWLRLVQLQIFESQRYRQAGRNLKIRYLPTQRGTILTADNQVLAQDSASWDLMINFGKWEAKTRSDLLAAYNYFDLPLNPEILDKKIQKAFSRYEADKKRELKRTRRKKLSLTQEILLKQKSYLLLKRVPKPIWQMVLSQGEIFQGLSAKLQPRRTYPLGNLATHITGQLSLFSAQDRKKMNANGQLRYPYYLDLIRDQSEIEIATNPQLRGKVFFPQDVIGRTGLEKKYENQLRGSRGVRIISKEIKDGQRTNLTLEEFPENPGQNIQTTLDSRLQNLCERGLERFCKPQGGGIVFLDAATGAIMALASWPTFPPTHITQEMIHDNVGRPLENKCFQKQIPLASVFKIVTSIAALEENIFNKSTQIDCSVQGFKARGTPRQRCWIANKYEKGHGPLQVGEALAHSCNIWFFNAALKLKYRRLYHWAKMFGFGEKTGIDLGYEASGQLPSKKNPEVTNFAIGQGNFQATILQCAKMMAVVANNGKVVVPYIVEDKSVPSKKYLPIQKKTWQTIHEGLRKTVTEGTAAHPVLQDLKVSGKTGTAQLSQDKKSHLWFSGYVTINQKKLAFATCLFNAGDGEIKAYELIAEILLAWKNLPS